MSLAKNEGLNISDVNFGNERHLIGENKELCNLFGIRILLIKFAIDEEEVDWVLLSSIKDEEGLALGIVQDGVLEVLCWIRTEWLQMLKIEL